MKNNNDGTIWHYRMEHVYFIHKDLYKITLSSPRKGDASQLFTNFNQSKNSYIFMDIRVNRGQRQPNF